MKLQFIYGEIPFWRAEVGRLALYFGDIDFDDVRIKRDEFPKDMITLFPKLKRLCLEVDNHEKIKSWVQKTYPNNYPRGNF